MNSERLKIIASKISQKDIVLDVGTDHGYLSIMLKKNKLCKEVYASEISKKALETAQNNFRKYHVQIKSFLSDGFKDIPVSFNTAVIAGMCTHTILNILKDPHTPEKLIIASNNNYYLLRKNLNKMGYKIVTEEAVLENNHYYIILLCIRANQKLKKKELLYGISNNEEYYKYLIEERKKIISQVPLLKKIKLVKECLELKGLIEKK